MATPVRVLIIAVLLLTSMGASHAQEQPQSKPFRLGLPYPTVHVPAQPGMDPLEYEALTDVDLTTYAEDAGADWRKKEYLIPFNDQPIFPIFSTAEERDGGRSFYAELKPNALFHDGSIATLDDVEFSLNRFPDRTIAHNNILFTKLSRNSFTLSSHRVENWIRFLNVPLKKRTKAGGGIVSAGPYIVTSVDMKKRKVRLKAFEKCVSGPPLAPEVEYTLYRNSDKMMFGFLAGEIDFMCGLNYSQEKVLGNIQGRTVMRYADASLVQLVFNTAKSPTDNVLVRKAISLLIDRHALVSRNNTLRNAIPSQIQFAMSPPVSKPYADPPAPVEAFKLLQKAGYSRTAKGWEKDGMPIRISIEIPTLHSSYISEARLITRWLNEAGLNANLSLNSGDYLHRISSDHHIKISEMHDKFEFSENSELYRPGSSSNLFRNTDSEPANMLAGAKSALLTTTSKEAIIRKVAEYYYTVPLFYPVAVCVGKGGTGYEEMFFRSPILHSTMVRTAPPGQLLGQTGHK
jgi:ABC-type transport system substrate-binding protein